jgi:hypothetical protein
VCTAIRVLNRLERVGETLRAALNSLAIVAPYGITLLGPVVDDPSWQARAGLALINHSSGRLGSQGRDLPHGQVEYFLAPKHL